MVAAFLDKNEYTVSEVVGTLEVCVVLGGFIDREVALNLSTEDGTAKGLFYNSVFLQIFIFYFLILYIGKFSCL